jgi:hypothetical protein
VNPTNELFYQLQEYKTYLRRQKLETPFREKQKSRFAGQRDWIRWVLAHHYRNRVYAFRTVQRHFNNRTYWRLLSNIMRSYMFTRSDLRLWYSLAMSPRGEREFFARRVMDREHWLSLPEIITVYRGWGCYSGPHSYNHGSTRVKSGLVSFFFTIDEKAAQMFAGNSGQQGHVAAFKITKSKSLYRGGRLANELIYLPLVREIAMNPTHPWWRREVIDQPSIDINVPLEEPAPKFVLDE